MAGNDANTILLLHFDTDPAVDLINDAVGGDLKTLTWVNGDPAVVTEIVNVSSNMTTYSRYRNFFIDDPVPDIYFEVFMRQTSGKVTASLYDVTDGITVEGSQVQSTSATFERVRSGPIVLQKDHEYQREMGVNETDAGEIIFSQILGV